MKRFKMWIFISVALTLSSVSPASEKKGKKARSSVHRVLTLGKIDGESSEKMTILTLRLSRKPDWPAPNLSAHGSFLQMKLPGTVVLEPGVFYDINSPWLKKAVAYQSGESDAIIRIFTGSDPESILKATDTDLLDQRLIVSVSHKAMGPPPDETVKPSVKDKSLSGAGSKKIQDPAVSSSENLAGRSASEPGITGMGPSPGLNAVLVKLAWFSVGMFLFILAVLSLRRVFRNRKLMASGPSGSVPMKTLNDLVLAPRQKLSLVQVGGEKLLLSVSPDGISLISHLDDVRRKHQAMSHQLLQDQGQSPSPTPARLSRLLKNHRNRGREGGGTAVVQPSRPAYNERKRQVTEKASTSSEGAAPKKAKKSSYRPVNYTVDDDGIHAKTTPDNTSSGESKTTEKAIDDVTQLIREKLKSLPRI